MVSSPREGEAMDEHDTPAQDDHSPMHPLPAWAPVPPAATPLDAWPDAAAAPDAPERRRRRPRLLAAGTAVAVVVAAGGAGFALGHHEHGAGSDATPPNGYFG